MSESDDFVVIKLLPASDPAVNEIMEQLFSVFAKHKGLNEAFSALVYLFAMLIRHLPPSERKRLVRAMVKPILAVSADMARANPHGER
jgi:hypothetical protein